MRLESQFCTGRHFFEVLSNYLTELEIQCILRAHQICSFA